MQKRKFFKTLLFILFPAIALAQGGSTVQSEITKMLPNPVPLSPNAAAIAKYGDYGVSHYTGLPEISIPLYEVKSGSLTIPITLSYHAGGVKYTDQASWVGLGWSLSAGGQISRQMNGKADEEFYYSNPFPTSINSCSDYNYYADLSNGSKDAQPDLFSYTYPGKSGKFMLTQAAAGVARDYFLIPYEPIKIRDEDYSSGFNWFEITDESGTVYRFGKNSASAVAVDGTTSNSGGVYTNVWHLMNMAAANTNDNISISYQSVGTTSTTDINQSFTIVDECLNTDGLVCVADETINVSTQNVSTTSTQTSPDEILFEGGKVEFELTANRLDLTSAKALSQINIYNEIRGAYVLKKSIKFVYSYFTNSAGTINLRLKLDGIQMLDASGTVVNQHRFTYFTNTFSWDAPFNSLRRDHWGFYNGATSNTNLIPVMTIDFNEGPGQISYIPVGGATDRNPNLTYLKEGVLKKIEFPTGGYSEFDFEEHKYYEGSAKSAGGLRVTSITSDDGTGTAPVVKTYKYGLAENGYGEKNFNNQLSSFINQVTINYWQSPYSGDPKYKSRSRTFFSSSMLSMDGNEGSPVLYTYVTEYMGTTSTNIGKTVYEYDGGTFTPDTHQGISNSGKTFRSSKSWMRGKLTKKSVYNSSGALLSKTEIGYSDFQGITKDIGHIAAKRVVYTGIYVQGMGQFVNPCLSPNQAYDGAEYLAVPLSQASGAKRQSSVTETFYPEGNPSKFVQTVSTTTFNSNYLQPETASQTTSNSTNKLITKSKYPFSYTFNGSETGNAKALRLMKERNIISVPVEQYVLRENSGVISGNVSTFVENPANTSQLVPDVIYSLESATPATESTTYTSLVSNALSINALFKKRVQLSFTAQGGVKDILRIDNSGTVNDMPVTYRWGYNNSLPVAEVKNAINTEALTENFEDISATTGSAHTGLQYYSGDYTVNFTKPNGRNYVVDYWYLDGTWKYIRKTYTGPTAVLNEGTAIDDVRIYPEDALATTWTHDPVNGITSAIDPNGQTQFYTYDSFGRLQLVSDTDKNVVKGYNYHYKQQ